MYKKNDYAIYAYLPKEVIRGGTRPVDGILPINVIETPVKEVRFKFFDAERNDAEENYQLRLAIEEWTPNKPGKVASYRALDNFVNLLSLLPDLHVNATISKGADTVLRREYRDRMRKNAKA